MNLEVWILILAGVLAIGALLVVDFLWWRKQKRATEAFLAELRAKDVDFDKLRRMVQDDLFKGLF